MDADAALQLGLVIFSLVAGVAGIVFLLSKEATRQTVGVLLFPLTPAIVFFLINFSTESSAGVDFIGQFGGPIAAYVGVTLLAYQLVKRDEKREAREQRLAELEQSDKTLRAELAEAKAVFEKRDQEYRDLRENMETTRSPRLPSGIANEYALPDAPERKIVIYTGGISDVKNVDVVVSSENDEMMLARYYDRSISGTLRYLDADRDGSGYVVKDNLAETLANELKSKNYRLPVRAGTVIPTPTVRLAERGIKYVFHAASVKGEPAEGYQPVVAQLDDCVENSFLRLHELAALAPAGDAAGDPPAAPPEPLTSILFPLLGAGTAKLSPREAARRMLPAIIKAMQETPEVQTTYVLAFVESHRDALREVAQAHNLAEVSPA